MLFVSITSMTWSYPYHFAITIIVCFVRSIQISGNQVFLRFIFYMMWYYIWLSSLILSNSFEIEFLPLAILAWDHGKLGKKYKHCLSWQWWCINKRSNTVLFIYLCMDACLSSEARYSLNIYVTYYSNKWTVTREKYGQL